MAPIEVPNNTSTAISQPFQGLKKFQTNWWKWTQALQAAGSVRVARHQTIEPSLAATMNTGPYSWNMLEHLYTLCIYIYIYIYKLYIYTPPILINFVRSQISCFKNFGGRYVNLAYWYPTILPCDFLLIVMTLFCPRLNERPHTFTLGNWAELSEQIWSKIPRLGKAANFPTWQGPWSSLSCCAPFWMNTIAQSSVILRSMETRLVWDLNFSIQSTANVYLYIYIFIHNIYIYYLYVVG